LELIAFGSSLDEDLILASFDVRCSKAHVAALFGGGILSASQASELNTGLDAVGAEIAGGSFEGFARGGTFEDVHGAIDARVRELTTVGESLHAGRSRNDQVATTLLLYARDRAARGRALCAGIASAALARAREELAAGTVLAGTTHWQPAQPILLAFWLGALAEMFVRGARRFARVEEDAGRFCPLGSGALSGSSLKLDRAAAAAALGFGAPSRNAMDAIGTRDVALDLAHACVRAVVDASRASEEFVMWCTPAFGYARLSDSASTGSSLMPQKRNPDPFELVRSQAAALNGAYSGAVGTTAGIALSYHRDLQTTKALIIGVVEKGVATLGAFARAFDALAFDRERMGSRAADGYTVATDLADALIAGGESARDAHATIGRAVAEAEANGTPLHPSFDANASVAAKKTAGSTSPAAVAAALDGLAVELLALGGSE
jgi:argininosuccinate lyase